MPEFDCRMLKKGILIVTFVVQGFAALTQQNLPDTSIAAAKMNSADTTIDYESLFQDFDSFMDSILSPHSYFLASISVGKGYFNFEKKGTGALETTKKLSYSPTIGYYDKGGLGITAVGYIVNDNSNMNFYQYSIAPSFDYLQNKDIATGISFTKYFTRDSLSFYTSPLENELYTYFTYRKIWVKPTVSLSYGWGSRSDYRKRMELIQSLRLRPRGYTYVNTTESVSDLSLMVSVRHDFYWLDVFTYNDHIRFTPQLSFTSGTQKFGFNQSSETYATTVHNGSNVLFSTQNVFLDNRLDFQPLSLTMYLRGEYSIGKFFFQPQLLLDYYFPSTKDNFNVLFSVNAGILL
jgi:hypothetical protein